MQFRSFETRRACSPKVSPVCYLQAKARSKKNIQNCKSVIEIKIGVIPGYTYNVACTSESRQFAHRQHGSMVKRVKLSVLLSPMPRRDRVAPWTVFMASTLQVIENAKLVQIALSSVSGRETNPRIWLLVHRALLLRLKPLA